MGLQRDMSRGDWNGRDLLVSPEWSRVELWLLSSSSPAGLRSLYLCIPGRLRVPFCGQQCVPSQKWQRKDSIRQWFFFFSEWSSDWSFQVPLPNYGRSVNEDTSKLQSPFPLASHYCRLPLCLTRQVKSESWRLRRRCHEGVHHSTGLVHFPMNRGMWWA